MTDWSMLVPGETDDNPYFLHDICCDPDDHPLRGHRFPECCTLVCKQCEKERMFESRMLEEL